MTDEHLIDKTDEVWVPEAPDDERPAAESVECHCGELWYPDYEDSCPSCGREEDEAELDDESWHALL